MAKICLPPGFRFHPTDVELILYFLKRKIMGKKLHFEAIAEIDIYKFDPWTLPEKSCLQSKDLEWYFYCPKNRRYTNGSRRSRATPIGYWKTTGNDRTINHNSRIVGMKKTLVFHGGRAPNGLRTNWVMHEYRMEDPNIFDTSFSQDAYVICKVFEKSGLGPKNGEEHGAPFVEDEWDDKFEKESGIIIPDFSPYHSSHVNPLSEFLIDDRSKDQSSVLNASILDILEPSDLQLHPVDSHGFDEYLTSVLGDEETSTDVLQKHDNEAHLQMPDYINESNMEKTAGWYDPGFCDTLYSVESGSKNTVHLDNEHAMPSTSNFSNEWAFPQDTSKIDGEYMVQDFSEVNYQHNVAGFEPYIEMNDLLCPMWDVSESVNSTTILACSSAFGISNNADTTTCKGFDSVTPVCDVDHSEWQHSVDMSWPQFGSGSRESSLL